MKKAFLPLLLFLVISNLFSQKIDIDDDFITINKIKVASIVSTKKFDSFYVKDLNNTMKFIFCIKTNGAQDQTRATWFQVLKGDQSIYTDIIPQKFRMFKMKLGIAEELVFQKLINEQGFNEEEIKTFFATKRKSYTDELNAAGLAQKLANEKAQKIRDSIEVIYNSKENINNRTSIFALDIVNNEIINRKKNNEVIGFVEILNENMTFAEFKLLDIDKAIVASCKYDWGNTTCTKYDGHIYSLNNQNKSNYTVNAANATILRGCDFGKQLTEMKNKEIELLKQDFYCGMDFKQKYSATLYKQNKDSVVGEFQLADLFQSRGNIINLSGESVYKRFYTNDKGKEKVEGYKNSERNVIKFHSNNCKFISSEVPAKPSKETNIGIGSISMNYRDYNLCKEIYYNKKYTIFNCQGIPSVYNIEEGIAYRIVNNELENFLKKENKKNEGKTPLTSFDYDSMIKWAKQFEN
jgi:hypothetical protein